MKVFILFLVLSSAAIAQSKPISTDSSRLPLKHVVYGDTVFSKEDKLVLPTLVRLRQLNLLCKAETNIPEPSFDQFMLWLELRVIQGHSPQFTRKQLEKLK